MRTWHGCPIRCGVTSASAASSTGPAFTIFASECMAGSEAALTRVGCRSPPSGYNFVDPAARHFYLNGSMFMIPVQGYHRYVGPSATMRVTAAGLVRLVDVSGHEMNQGETVTLFNDMCVMAPATLVDHAIVWEPVDERTARATFTNAGQTMHAELSFNEAGELSNFWSDDRYRFRLTAPRSSGCDGRHRYASIVYSKDYGLPPAVKGETM